MFIRSVPDEMLMAFEAMYRSGDSMTRIAETTDYDRTTVHYWLIKRGVPRRSISQAMRRYVVREDAFAAIDDQPTAYWLGFLYADGCIHGKHEGSGGVTLALKGDDIEHVHRFAKFMESAHPIKTDHRNGSNRIVIESIKIRDDLIRHGCFRAKSCKLAFPDLSPHLRSHFIRGYFDGDGSAYVSGGTPNLNFCGNIEFLEGIRGIIEDTIGIEGYIRSHTVSRKASYLIYRGKFKARAVAAWLYYRAEVFLPRKKTVSDAFEPLKKHAGSIGHVSAATIERYIAEQKGK